jgi:hypothetical protein
LFQLHRPPSFLYLCHSRANNTTDVFLDSRDANALAPETTTTLKTSSFQSTLPTLVIYQLLIFRTSSPHLADFSLFSSIKKLKDWYTHRWVDTVRETNGYVGKAGLVHESWVCTVFELLDMPYPAKHDKVVRVVRSSDLVKAERRIGLLARSLTVAFFL